jgi:hypothetical protein
VRAQCHVGIRFGKRDGDAGTDALPAPVMIATLPVSLNCRRVRSLASLDRGRAVSPIEDRAAMDRSVNLVTAPPFRQPVDLLDVTRDLEVRDPCATSLDDPLAVEVGTGASDHERQPDRAHTRVGDADDRGLRDRPGA